MSFKTINRKCSNHCCDIENIQNGDFTKLEDELCRRQEFLQRPKLLLKLTRNLRPFRQTLQLKLQKQQLKKLNTKQNKLNMV